MRSARRVLFVAGALLVAHGCAWPLSGQDRAVEVDGAPASDGSPPEAVRDASPDGADSTSPEPPDIAPDGADPTTACGEFPDAGFPTGVLFTDVDTLANKLEVYALGDGGEIQRFAGGGGVTPWVFNLVNGGSGSLSPQAPRMAPASPVVAYANMLSGVNELFYLTPSAAGGLDVEQLRGSHWSPTDVSSAVSDAGAPAAVAGSSLVGYIDSNAGTDNVFYVGADQHVHALVWSAGAAGAGWSTLDVSARAGAPVDVSGSVLSGHIDNACAGGGTSGDGGSSQSRDAGASGSEDVFYVGSDLHVHQLSRSSGSSSGWHDTDINGAVAEGSTASAAACGSPLVSFSDPFAALDVLFYFGADGDLHELYLSCGSPSWSTQDLTSQTNGAPPCVGNSLAAHQQVDSLVAPSNPAEEVWCETKYDQTYAPYEFWGWSTHFDGWHSASFAEALVKADAAAAGAAFGTPIALDIDPFGDDGGVQEEAYYVGADGHVHELSKGRGSWFLADVTAAAADGGAPSSIP